MKLLLIQIRQPNSMMALHEQECLRRRLADRPVEITIRNVLTDQAQAHWLEGMDAIVLGGSGDFSVNDTRSKAFVEPLDDVLSAALDQQVPGFGICFGHQLLGQHLGSPVLTEAARAEVGTIDMHLTDEGRNDPIFSVLDATFGAVTGHTDHVSTIPAGTTVLATNNTLSTQAFKVDGAPFYSTQFHPDLTAEEARERYLAVQKKLALVAPDATPEAANNYRPGHDAAVVLIGRFADAVIEGII